MEFTTVPLVLALLLGALSAPLLPIYAFNRRGLGIVRYHFGELRASARRVLSSLFSWRLAAALALIVAVMLFTPTDAGATPMLCGIVLPGMGSGLEKQLAAYLGRNQGPEFFTSTPHNGTAQTVLIPRNLNINRPLEALIFRWRGRVVIAGANYTAAAAESPMSIINKIRVNGTFKGTALTPINLSGATAFVWPRLFGIRGSSAYISTGGGALTRQAEPGVPFAQTLANFGNIGTYDLDLWYVVPTWPIVSGSSRADEIVPYLWQPQDWSDSLQITLDLGDLTSFGTPAAMTTATFTAFGSGAGTPTVEIYTRYAILGTFRPGSAFRTACVVRNEQTITAGLTGIAQNVRVMPLQKQKTTNILVKSGLLLAGTSAGVQVFASLSDVQLDRSLIVVDNKFIRNNFSNLASKESVGYQFTTIEPEGYLPFTFIDSQTPRTAFRADDPNVVGAGANFELDTDVLTANAQNAVNVVQEMIFADRDDPSWAGTR